MEFYMEVLVLGAILSFCFKMFSIANTSHEWWGSQDYRHVHNRRIGDRFLVLCREVVLYLRGWH